MESVVAPGPEEWHIVEQLVWLHHAWVGSGILLHNEQDLLGL